MRRLCLACSRKEEQDRHTHSRYTDVPTEVVAEAQSAVRMLPRYCYLNLSQREEALQEAIVAAWEAYTAGLPCAGIRQSAWNALRRWWRSENRWKRCMLLTETFEEENEEGINLRDNLIKEYLEELLEIIESEQVLAQLDLKREDYRLLTMVAQGLNQAEIAQRFGRSQAWVSLRIKAIRKKAREKISGSSLCSE